MFFASKSKNQCPVFIINVRKKKINTVIRKEAYFVFTCQKTRLNLSFDINKVWKKNVITKCFIILFII